MITSTSKYQANVITQDAETLVKNKALEEAYIPDTLGFIIVPSKVDSTSAAQPESSSSNNNEE